MNRSLPGRDGTKGISGRGNSMHKCSEAGTSKTRLEMVETSNPSSQAFKDAQGSIPLYPLEPSCPSTALKPPPALQPPTSCPSARNCLPPPPPATRLHCSSFKELPEPPGLCGHHPRGTHSRGPSAWADPGPALCLPLGLGWGWLLATL